MNPRVESLHRLALIGLAAFLGLFEGPAEILCVVVLLTTALTGRLRDLRAHPVLIGALLWAVAGTAGVITAEVRISSQGYLRPLHALALIVGGYGLRDVPDKVLARMAWAFCIAIVCNGGYGLLQVGVGPLPWDDLLRSSNNVGQIYVPGSRTELCASGLFYNRIRLAHVGAMGVCMMGVIAGSGARARVRQFAGLGLLVLVPALLFTYARMVLVACSLACMLLVLLLSKVRHAVAICGAGSTIVLMVASTEAGRARLARSGQDLEIRSRIFSMALRIFEQHPWYGAGHGAYTQHARPMLQPGWSRNWAVDAHNLYLHALAETGIVGLIGFMTAVLLGSLRMLQRVRNEARDQAPQAILHRVGFVVLLTFLVLGFLHQPLHHASVGISFWAVLGLGALAPTVRNQAERATDSGFG